MGLFFNSRPELKCSKCEMWITVKDAVITTCSKEHLVCFTCFKKAQSHGPTVCPSCSEAVYMDIDDSLCLPESVRYVCC